VKANVIYFQLFYQDKPRTCKLKTAVKPYPKRYRKGKKSVGKSCIIRSKIYTNIQKIIYS